MKVSVALCVLALVALAYCRPQGYYTYPWSLRRGNCKEGSHLSVILCDLYDFYVKVIPESTCDNPTPQEVTETCDYVECHCDAPTVRDTASGKCVPLEQCPKK